MTNGEIIRGMTDEELSVWLVKTNMCDTVCEHYDGCADEDGCCARVLLWLKGEEK